MPPLIPVWGELSENSRLGFEAKNPAWHPGSTAANSTTSIGFRASLFLNVIRQIHSARYYNPATGGFTSRDPLDGLDWDPKTLHKYLYVRSNPVNNVDPRGRDLLGYAIRSNAAIPEAKLISIYGCVADASLAAIDLILGQINPSDTTANIGAGLGAGSAVLGCVVLAPGLNELAEQGNRIVKFVKLVGDTSGWGSCAADVEDFINGLNDLATGRPAEDEIAKSIEHLGGCVQTALGYLLTHPGKTLQGLGL
jgi:RHS repeat-associated protein